MLAAWPRTFAESDWCGEYYDKNDVAGREQPKPKP